MVEMHSLLCVWRYVQHLFLYVTIYFINIIISLHMLSNSRNSPCWIHHTPADLICCYYGWYWIFTVSSVQIVCWVRLVMKIKTTCSARPPAILLQCIHSPTMPSTCGTRTTWSSLCPMMKAHRAARCCWPPSLTSPLSSRTYTARRVTTLWPSPPARGQTKRSVSKGTYDHLILPGTHCVLLSYIWNYFSELCRVTQDCHCHHIDREVNRHPEKDKRDYWILSLCAWASDRSCFTC